MMNRVSVDVPPGVQDRLKGSEVDSMITSMTTSIAEADSLGIFERCYVAYRHSCRFDIDFEPDTPESREFVTSLVRYIQSEFAKKSDTDQSKKLVTKHCRGCLADVTDSMFCYCGEFCLTEAGVITSGYKEIETGKARVFVDITIPNRLYVLPSGYRGKYLVIEEDQHTGVGYRGYMTKEEVESKYSIEL